MWDFIHQNIRSAFSPKLWKNVPQHPLASYIHKNSVNIILQISTLHAKFCMIPFNRIRDRTTAKILRKTEQQRRLLSYMYLNSIIVIPNDIYFQFPIILCMGNFSNRTNFLLTVFDGFARLGIRRIQKIQKLAWCPVVRLLVGQSVDRISFEQTVVKTSFRF